MEIDFPFEEILKLTNDLHKELSNSRDFIYQSH